MSDGARPILADVALAAPRRGIVEVAGPERAPFDEIVARYLRAIGDPREGVRVSTTSPVDSWCGGES